MFRHSIPLCCTLTRHLSSDMTKPTKWVCAQRTLRSAWASAQSDQSSLSTWRNLGSLATHWAHSEDSEQTRRIPRLIWVFAGRSHYVCFVMSRLIYVLMNCVRVGCKVIKFFNTACPYAETVNDETFVKHRRCVNHHELLFSLAHATACRILPRREPVATPSVWIHCLSPRLKLFFSSFSAFFYSFFIRYGRVQLTVTTASVWATPGGYFRCVCVLAWVTDSTYFCVKLTGYRKKSEPIKLSDAEAGLSKHAYL